MEEEKKKGTQAPHLVLHFDVNKTLVMLDPAGGKGSVEEMINDLLTEIAYGTVGQDGEWRPVEGAQLGTTNAPPRDHACPETLVSYYDYLGRKLPADKPLRDRLREPLRHHYDMFLRAMRSVEWLEVETDPSDAPTSDIPQYHYILPSFLELLKYLKENDYSFTLVFRTFGQDLPHLTEHFDEFCEGKHPLYRGFVMDGSDGKPDYRIRNKTDQHGAFFRHGRGKHETHLALGLWDQIPNPIKLDEWEKGNVNSIDFYTGNEDVKKVLTGFDAIHDHIHSVGPCTLALRDYFPWWRANADAAFAGKLFTVDQSDARTHPIFFDDNIHFNGSQPEWKNIVDLRDKLSSKPLAHRHHLGRHLVKVEPAEAIREVNYYQQAIEMCLKSNDEGDMVLRATGLSKAKASAGVAEKALKYSNKRLVPRF